MGLSVSASAFPERLSYLNKGRFRNKKGAKLFTENKRIKKFLNRAVIDKYLHRADNELCMIRQINGII